jgi:hypothetical protein
MRHLLLGYLGKDADPEQEVRDVQEHVPFRLFVSMVQEQQRK